MPIMPPTSRRRIKARFGAAVPGPGIFLHPEDVTISATLTADFDADPL